ncbi:MAG: PTS lactose/cellobiose transporter subunit IIA [Enterococcus avium]
MNDKIIESAMKIILYAGDARVCCNDALDAAISGKFDETEDQMAKAHIFIVKAHKIQTEIIQDEARGKAQKYSMLFTHAQDTLMTINSEIVLVKKIIKFTKKTEDRLRKLEENK